MQSLEIVASPTRRRAESSQAVDEEEQEAFLSSSRSHGRKRFCHVVCDKKTFILGSTVVIMILLTIRLFMSKAPSEETEATLFPGGTLQFSSGVVDYDNAFALAMREVSENIVNETFIAGAGWTQLWTRDTSYSVQLATALIHPRASRRTLEKCTHDITGIGVTWLQDECGHFQGWPNLSDAIVGAQGAWSLYLTTGNTDFLAWAFEITKRTLAWAERDVYDASSGLFRGCSSFMESNSGYPSKYRMNGKLVGQTKALSTNVLYYNGYTIAAQMARELEMEDDDYNEKALLLAQAIRSHLWQDGKGYYAYFEDESQYLVTQMEGLGESLLLLALDLETNATRIESIFSKTYRSSVGIPCLWPRFNISENYEDDASYYHNGRIWPFVQGYWAIAAAKHGRTDIFGDELQHLMHLANNITFAEFYELDGSFLWMRRRQLWSSAGFLAMVFHGLFGIHLQPEGIDFRPVIPANLLPHTLILQNLEYRKARLTIHVSGSGSILESFKLNGSVKPDAFLPSDAVGDQIIEMSLKDTA